MFGHPVGLAPEMATERLQSYPRLQWDIPSKVAGFPRITDEPNAPDAVLELACFVKPPTLCFENVKVGTTSLKTLKIFNPGTERETVLLEKFPSAESGFAVVNHEKDRSLCFELEPQEETAITISWHPLVACSSRHMITFKWLGAQKLQAIILVSSYDPNAKRNKTKRFGSRKILRQSHRDNIIQKAPGLQQAKKFLSINKQAKADTISNVCKSPNVERLIDIAPDTPSRRATFNVVQPAIATKEELREWDDGKENHEPRLDDSEVPRATFTLGKDKNAGTNSKKCMDGTSNLVNGKPVLQIEDNAAKNKAVEKKSADESAFQENSVMSGSTFHESEIRLSSSPIRWYQARRLPCQPNNDLHPGQVVMNGEVKHAFIPYPSFDNTDTFWNMEMSTANKHKSEPLDASLSFGSAASSLFTITREEKFSSDLEAVSEIPSVYATPIGGKSGSNTTTCREIGEDVSEATLVARNDAINDNGTFSIEDGKDVTGCHEERPVEHGCNSLEKDEVVLENKERPTRFDEEPLQVPKEGGEARENENEVNGKLEDDETLVEKERTDKETEEVEVSKSEKVNTELGVMQSSESAAVNPFGTKQVKRVDDCGKNAVKRRDSGLVKKDTRSQIIRRNRRPSSPVRSQQSKTALTKPFSAQQRQKDGALKQDSNSKKTIEGHITDSKFKAVVLPQKRPSDAGPPRSGMVKPSIAVKKLRLERPKHGKIAKHPMPYAAKNMFYDERWIEKQERGFKNWLNFVLTAPDDGEDCGGEEKRGKLAFELDSNQPVAPTKETLSFRLYTARRRMAKLRRDACTLYQCDQLASVIQKLEREIAHGRLAIRADRHVDADLGVRKHIADMLLSFNPLWLRIGLEVVFGEIIPMPSSDSVSFLSRFIHRRLLGNPEIAEEYSHPSVPGLFKPGYVEALGKFTLKKLLLVIIFLDKAKISRLMSHDPCLFNKDSQFKSTRDMLLMFSRDYLHREGDVVKHLTYLGYAVSHVQTPLHEFDFGVNSLTVDLRDGMRLVRVVELLTENWNLSPRLRIPAVSRLQKVHNVELALSGLKDAKLDIKSGAGIDARFIVDGHREKTLLLLWQIIFHFQVDVLLDETKLREEISYLEKSKKISQAYKNIRRENESLGTTPEVAGSDLSSKSDKLSLLLKWCRLVGQLHGVQVENFTVSFSDGRALCYLMHHYHPALLQKEAIHDDTSVTCSVSKDDDHDVDDDLVFQNWIKPKGSGESANSNLAVLLSNEKKNFGLFCEKVKEIGPSPAMMLASDMSNTIPDEKVVVVFLSFLCSRLLDLREEIRAARSIQLAWRHHKLRKEERQLQAQEKAVIKLQRIARGFLERKHRRKMEVAASTIQAAWRSHKSRRQQMHDWKLEKERRRDAAARKIQAVVRGFISRTIYRKKKMAIHFLQQTIRDYLCCKKERMRIKSATLIQRRFRESRVAYAERALFLRKRESALKLQRVYREYQRRRQMKLHNAACVVQSAWKTYLARKRFVERRNAVVHVQKCWRGYRCRRRYLCLRKSVETLQEHFRARLVGAQARREFLEKRAAAAVLQRACRGFLAKQHARRQNACVCIQACFRAYKCRKWYNQLRSSTVKLQAILKRSRCQREYRQLRAKVVSVQRIRRAVVIGRTVCAEFKRQREACVAVQAAYRGKKARDEFLVLKASALKVQSVWRGKACRMQYRAVKAAVAVIETAFVARKLMRLSRTEFLHMRISAIKIQAAFRAFRQRRRYLQLRKATFQMQAIRRSIVQREMFMSKRKAAITIQRRLRAANTGKAVRRSYKELKSSAVFIQAMYRCKHARSGYSRLRTAAVVIQRRYRAMKLSQEAQVHFLITKAAIISIQSAYRGHSARKEIKARHLAAEKIQSFFRMHQVKREFLRLKESAVCIQRRYRATSLMLAAVEEFKELRNAAILLQAVSRGFAVRRRARKANQAALTIQTAHRGAMQRQRYKATQQAIVTIQKNTKAVLSRRRFLRMKTAAEKIQNVYRSYQQTKAAVEEYQRKRALVVSIQLLVRRFLKRKSLKENIAACKIQAAIRGLIDRKRFLKQRALVMNLQRSVRLKFDARRRDKAASCIQQSWRGHKLAQLQRSQYLEVRDSCVLLQSVVRKWLAEKRFVRMKRAILVIQGRYRAQRTMQKSRECYGNIRRKVVLIQSVYRMHRTTKEYKAKRNAVILLQTRTRQMLETRRTMRMTKAASTIQCWFRATVIMRRERQHFLLARSSAVVLQAAFRALVARGRFSASRKAAIQIQSWFRMAVARKAYLAKRHAALVIQARYRAHVACQDQSLLFHYMRGAAITIQASVKGFQARRQFLAKRKSAVLIQTAFRRYRLQRRYQALRQAVTFLQRRARANQATHARRQDFLKKRSSAVIIQRAFRRYLNTKQAVIFMQSVCRMRRHRKRFVELRKSCITIQRLYRQHRQRKEAAVRLQSFCRMVIARRQYTTKREACVKLQSFARMHIARRNYSLQQQAALVLQTRYRALVSGSLQRQRYIAERRSCIKIQAAIRMRLSQRRFVRLKQSALLIQEQVRAFNIMKSRRAEFLRLKTATIFIQACYRGYKARKVSDRLMKRKLLENHLKLVLGKQTFYQRQAAAVAIQKNFRTLVARKNFLLLKQSTMKIQRFYRSHLLAVRVQKEYQNKREKVRLLQRTCRVYLAKKKLLLLKREAEEQNTAALSIQATFKGYMARKEYRKRKMAAVTIQRWFKCMLVSKRTRNRYLLMKKGVTKIQHAYRSYVLKKRLALLIAERKRRQSAALVIQSAFRGYVARKEFIRLREATVFCQCLYRSIRLTRCAKVRYLRMKGAALTIQREFRKRREELQARAAKKKVQEENAIRIQRRFRAHQSMLSCRKAFQKQRTAAIVIQRGYRSFAVRQSAKRTVAASKIQAAFRRFRAEKLCEKRRVAVALIERWYLSRRQMKEERNAYLNLRKAVLCIQTCFRGYLVRRRIVDQKVIKARERIENATAEATEPRKLCNRTKSALSYLLNCRNVTTIYEALRNLEVSTRLSQKCCEKLVEDNALTVILQIMRNCNRSLPSMEQISMALSVLVNVSKCQTTYMAIVEEGEFLQQVTEIMVNFREKKKIFPLCCKLLSILCRDESVARLLRDSDAQLKKLKGLNSLIDRKAKIEQRRNYTKVATRASGSSKEGKDSLTVIEQLNCMKTLVQRLALV